MVAITSFEGEEAHLVVLNFDSDSALRRALPSRVFLPRIKDSYANPPLKKEQRSFRSSSEYRGELHPSRGAPHKDALETPWEQNTLFSSLI
jgi:hypothetical protein